MDCTISSTPSNYKSVHDNRFHGDEDHDPRSDLSQGGGYDAEHPTFIPMYTPTTLQDPRGHMTRPRTYAIGHKVNSLLFEPSLSTCETWLLPHTWTLPILRYNRDDHGESKDQDKHARGEGRRRMEQDRTCPDHPDTQSDDPDRARTIRTIRLTCPKTPEASRRSRIIRTVTRIIRTPDTRIIRTPPACVTWAEARVPLRPSLTPSWLSTINRPPPPHFEG